MRTPHRTLLVLAVATAVMTGCTSSGSNEAARSAAADPAEAPARTGLPAELQAVAAVDLREPAATGAGTAPVFAWDAVDGAAAYRLSVLGASGPVWAWQGPETRVRMGLATEDGDDALAPVQLREPGHWSVTALDADGGVIAVSDLRPVSPDGRQPAAPWTSTAITADPLEVPSAAAAVVPPGTDPALDRLWQACADEDWAACDELYRDSPVDSQYETFGDTCGGRTTGGTWCEEELGGA